MGLHYKLDHLPLPTMITLSETRKLNKKFIKLKHRLPVCMYFIFGMSNIAPWCSKGTKDPIGRQQMMPQEHALALTRWSTINTPNGRLIKKNQIWAATILVDHYSDYVYVALMHDLTLDETLRAKFLFKRHAAESGVTTNFPIAQSMDILLNQDFNKL